MLNMHISRDWFTTHVYESRAAMKEMVRLVEGQWRTKFA